MSDDIKPTAGINDPYEGSSVPEDFSIPSVGIEDADRALFHLFDKQLSFEIEVDNQATRVPVVFSTGERFALTRRNQPIRDKNNAIILPIISIKRSSISHDSSQSGYGTPISHKDQQSYIIKRRLSKNDRDYQNIINKMGLLNQKNVASKSNFENITSFPHSGSIEGRVASRRSKSNSSIVNSSGDLLAENIGDNIFEVITIPYPTFVTLEYDITFWTQYMTQMNQIIESMMARFTGQGHDFLIETDAGYQFVAYLKSPLGTADNFSDFSSDERIVKYTFKMVVPAYILAPQHPGLPSPFRRTLSAPQIDFGIYESRAQIVTKPQKDNSDGDIDKFILSDVKLLNGAGDESRSRGQSDVQVIKTIDDPFTGKKIKKSVPILTRNQRKGETVANARVIIEIIREFE
ncbi:hypothetical protein CMI47_06885 [Candidatus Pacearchaeota archaeon]|nr:hypothetical protein [Candidatus Pacearchaeota archaeon]|tara:strand:+ start:2907 stop:4121 length:1215 start_codon:yes stop_codon:yes gene_type:complete